MADMVFSEEELISAAMQMKDYANLLVDYIGEYRAILQYIQAQGIVDSKVCTSLANLDGKILPYETALFTIGSNAMGTLMQSAGNLRTLDNYAYPEGNFEEVKSTLAGFLG